MEEISEIVDVVMTAFYNGDPNTVSYVWQALLHVRDAALSHEGGDDFFLAHLGWE